MSEHHDLRSSLVHGYFASIGLGSTLFPGVLWARVASGEEITVATIANAEEVAGLKFDEAERTDDARGSEDSGAAARGASQDSTRERRCPGNRFQPRSSVANSAAHRRSAMVRGLLLRARCRQISTSLRSFP